jgi:hypothetical protein
MAPAGGNAALQSPTGAHVRSPSFGRVAPAHGAGGSTAAQPHPLASRSKPAAHEVGPTATHASLPSAGRVPGMHDDAAAVKSSHVPSAPGLRPSVHVVPPSGDAGPPGVAVGEADEHALGASTSSSASEHAIGESESEDTRVWASTLYRPAPVGRSGSAHVEIEAHRGGHEHEGRDAERHHHERGER